MRTIEGDPAGQAESPNSPSQDQRKSTTAHAYLYRSGVSTPSHRRWKKRRRILSRLACDVVVWIVWFVMVAAIIAAMLAMLELARP